MKPAIALKISLLLLAIGLLASCASSSPQRNNYSRAAMPGHCDFQNQHNQSNPRKARERREAPPSTVTPIGGNYSVRN